MLPQILALDAGGSPSRWICYEEFALYQCTGKIAWSPTDAAFTLRGGINASGEQSIMEVPSIVALAGSNEFRMSRKHPTLSPAALFKRDRNICAYCGEKHNTRVLTMEHIIPESRNGATSWMNLVAACYDCNQRKRDRTPEEAGMPLLFLPYVPDPAEFLILSGRNILSDQMDYLKSRCKPSSRILLECA